jgi:hypothetical protein
MSATFEPNLDPPLRQLFKEGRKADYDELSTKLADLKCRGKGPLKIWQRCKRAGRLDEYEGLYGLFCIDAHGNSPALAERADRQHDEKSEPPRSSPHSPRAA